MPQCAVQGCYNDKASPRKYTNKPVSFHYFPKDPFLREIWIEAVHRDTWKPSAYSFICSAHFLEDDFDRSSPFRTYLRNGAIPTIFPGKGSNVKPHSKSPKTPKAEPEEVMPPKKKYRVSHRKSSDGNDRQVLVLKTVNSIKTSSNNNECYLNLETWEEELTPVQLAQQQKADQEYNDITDKLEQMSKQSDAELIHEGEVCTALELANITVPVASGAQNVRQQGNAAGAVGTTGTNQNYQLVVDPRLGIIVGTMTPTATAVTAQPTQVQPVTTVSTPPVSRRGGRRGRGSVGYTPATPPATAQKEVNNVTPTLRVRSFGKTTGNMAIKPTEVSAVGGINSAAPKSKTSQAVVDLTADDAKANDGKPPADSREVSFNKLQGKTFPSLVVVARPHLRVKEIAAGAADRPKLDAKVKSVLMHVPTKFTEWLIQQGVVRSEQSCTTHPNSKLKLGMYSDASKFPYSGGYVWISECCPTRFVSVFSGSLFEGSPHPPAVILKLIYHWSCQTNVQNVVQWVKVDNLYVKGLNTWLRSVCTVALHTNIKPLGGAGRRVEVGVISLGTTSQDGQQRQVKVEVLGLLETEQKLLRLRAVEPQSDGDRNYRKRFSKILEPLCQWVHRDSIIVTDLTVDKETLHSMGFANVMQVSATERGVSNHTVMEYLRRIVPRMFQNTLSLLSRQIIQQFLDELVWREWFGQTPLKAFENIIAHLAEQTRADTGHSLIMRLNKVAANPFKNWNYNLGQLPILNVRSTADSIISSSEPTRKLKRARKVYNAAANKSASPPPQDKLIRSISPDVPEEMVPLESYYYATIEGDTSNLPIKPSYTMKCSLCNKSPPVTFTNNIKLMTHLFMHAHNITGNVQQCRYCLSSVISTEGLVKHITGAHLSETKFGEMYACLICELRFTTSFQLGKHLSKEHVPAELPYQCGTCGFRCSSHRQAIDHFYKDHDGGHTIQCPFCLKSTQIFSSGRVMPQNLNYFMQHLQKHQKKALAKKCAKCSLWYINKETLKDHQMNMHASMRNSKEVTPSVCPANGLTVPKSRHDRQIWEEPDWEVNVANVTFEVDEKVTCKECNEPMNSTRHYHSLEGCDNENCQFSTFCASAMDAHKKSCKDLTDSLPKHALSKSMHCVCGYTINDGNLLAKHLAQCERKSAYPSLEAAKAAIKTDSMLDVLGLVRRPEETNSVAKKSAAKSEDDDGDVVKAIEEKVDKICNGNKDEEDEENVKAVEEVDVDKPEEEQATEVQQEEEKAKEDDSDKVAPVVTENGKISDEMEVDREEEKTTEASDKNEEEKTTEEAAKNEEEKTAEAADKSKEEAMEVDKNPEEVST